MSNEISIKDMPLLRLNSGLSLSQLAQYSPGLGPLEVIGSTSTVSPEISDFFSVFLRTSQITTGLGCYFFTTV